MRDVAVAALADRARDRDDHDRQEGGRLGLDLRLVEDDHEGGHEQDAAADAHHAADEAAGEAEEDHQDDVHERLT